MVDEKLSENLSETGVAGTDDRVAELERQLSEKEEALGRASSRITELEDLVSRHKTEIAASQQSQEELNERLNLAEGSLAEAVARYRALVVQANPDIIEEMLSGDSIEAIDQSLERARSLVSRVRAGLEAEIESARFPSGSPERRPPDLSGLSAREKIQHAMGSLSPR